MENITDDKLIPVTNFMNHKVVFALPEYNRRYAFNAYEKKQIPAGQLRALNSSNGGHVLLMDYLHVGSVPLAHELGVPEDCIEYNWTKTDVDNCLLKEPIEVLEDALDFAPKGIVEMLKDRAVELEIADNNKRTAIFEATGADITNIIANKHLSETETPAPEHRQRRVRRVNR